MAPVAVERAQLVKTRWIQGFMRDARARLASDEASSRICCEAGPLLVNGSTSRIYVEECLGEGPSTPTKEGILKLTKTTMHVVSAGALLLAAATTACSSDDSTPANT